MKAPSAGSQSGHAALVAENAAPRQRARRIDCQYRYSMLRLDEPHPQSIDQGALTDTRDATDPDPVRLPRKGNQLFENFLCPFAVCLLLALCQRDGLCKDPAATAPNAFDVLVDTQRPSI